MASLTLPRHVDNLFTLHVSPSGDETVSIFKQNGVTFIVEAEAGECSESTRCSTVLKHAERSQTLAEMPDEQEGYSVLPVSRAGLSL